MSRSGRDAIAAIGAAMLNDTWYLDWGLSTPGPTMAGTSQAAPSLAQISWSTQNVTGERAAVYRREAGTPWSSIATIENGGTGTLAYADHDVTPGGRCGYLLTVPSRRGAVAGGEIWVNVPTSASVNPPPPSFGLQPVRPNPVVDRFQASFTLVGEAAARIDLIDVTGRRVLSRDLSGLGPGPHEVDLGNARDFRSGLYFLRLIQADRSLARPVVLSGRRAN